jgi:pyruvate dehydrogenase E1 component
MASSRKYAVESGAYLRAHLFGPDPRLSALVAHLTDEDLVAMRRGGHDHTKLYAAYRAAVEHPGSPTVILAKTVKGWCLGPEIQGRNAAHQIKKMNPTQTGSLRQRLGVPDAIVEEVSPEQAVPDRILQAAAPSYYRSPEGSAEHDYLIAHRQRLGGSLPRRMVKANPIGQPDPAIFEEFHTGSRDRAVSTTMGFTALLRDKTIGPRIVPIIPDEGRTFGMDALFASVNIYAHAGQRYDPVDGAMQLSYRESRQGQILQEGITEAGSLASFTAASTAYATWGEPMVPFYVFYSMFGFQRVGDAIWALGDMRGRGFLLGATAGRTTLNGEGLQHQDGHSLVLASTVPNLAAYDPAFAYEVATIVRDGLARMYGDTPQDVFYYLTLYNENYPMPTMPDGAHEGILRGLHRVKPGTGPGRPATILFSGSAQGAAQEAQQLLAINHDVAAELWSVTSYKALREDALDTER